MDSEISTLSTIIIDSNGNPIGQVIYRCAICRKICDSSSDAMLHYQIDHIETNNKLLQQQQQMQKQTVVASAGAGGLNRGARGSGANLGHHQAGAVNRQFAANRSSAPSGTPSSLLKRGVGGSPTNSSGSLLKRTASGNSLASASTTSSLLKRASNVMRSYQSGGPSGSVGATGSTRNSNKRPSGNNPAANAAKMDTIHRPYTTTSASRAAKRYSSSGANAGSSSSSTNSASTQSHANNNNLTTSRNNSESSIANQNEGSSINRNRNSATPRHVQRTNQYTANLKAKINAQKSANTSTSSVADTKPGSDKLQATTSSTSISSGSQKTPTPSSSTQLSASSSNSQSREQTSSSDSNTPSIINNATANTSIDTTASNTTLNNTSTPGLKDPNKTYSLRSRSRRSVRIS